VSDRETPDFHMVHAGASLRTSTAEGRIQPSSRRSLNRAAAQKLTTHDGAMYQTADIGSAVHLTNPVTMNWAVPPKSATPSAYEMATPLARTRAGSASSTSSVLAPAPSAIKALIEPTPSRIGHAPCMWVISKKTG
jgi:hypothetical protein